MHVASKEYLVRPYVVVHPAWQVTFMLSWNIYFTSITLPVFHPYIDEMGKRMLRGFEEIE